MDQSAVFWAVAQTKGVAEKKKYLTVLLHGKKVVDLPGILKCHNATTKSISGDVSLTNHKAIVQDAC